MYQDKSFDFMKRRGDRGFLDKLKTGDRVWAPWTAATLFAGTVDEIKDKEVHIHFDDGDHGWVQLNQIMPLKIEEGLRVMGRWKMGAQVYPGTVHQVQGNRIHIHYDDGDKEWTTAAALHLSCKPFGPAARSTKTAFRLGGARRWISLAVLVAILLLLRLACA